MKKVFLVLMAVMMIGVMVGVAHAADVYVDLGYDMADHGNSDIDIANMINLGFGVQGDYGKCKPFLAGSAGISESGFDVQKRAVEAGAYYALDEKTTFKLSYKTEKYPTGDRANGLKLNVRRYF